MRYPFMLFTTAALLLGGCQSTPTCVGVPDESQAVMPARVVEKEKIEGKVVIRSPRGIMVADKFDMTAGGESYKGSGAGLAGVPAAAVLPAMTNAMQNPGLHSGKTSSSVGAVAGEACQEPDKLHENGAWRYGVRTRNGKTYFVHSA
jgi:hypothetical protein